MDCISRLYSFVQVESSVQCIQRRETSETLWQLI
nr:MAG TPA: hypothetical protein [Caudoviricetes sp.]DAW24394.1 MAG TPA: hypothetical protein [Caudoviricetes sp.]